MSTITLTDFHPRLDTFKEDFLRGLALPQKQISPKYLYDARGAQLFDRICELEEYFPTRTELGILQDQINELAGLCGPQCRLIEFGSGSSIKSRLLLDHLEELRIYVPIDISREQLVNTALKLDQRYPGVEVLPVCADYTADFELPEGENQARRTIVFFPGSTIGNFLRADAIQFLTKCRQLCEDGGALIIGIGLQTDRNVLERAYNDSEGVTAAFNLNLLYRARRELGASVDVNGFAHKAVYDEKFGRIEMRLVSKRRQAIHVCGQAFRFEPGDYIITEYSHKFTHESFSEMAAKAGLQCEQSWEDPDERFSVQYLTPA